VWSPDFTQRTLTNVRLFDVSVVANPAYNGTSVSARSAADYQPAPAETAALRARLAALDADFARREKLHELEMKMLAETFRTEKRGNQDWFADRCKEACSDLGLDYCQHDNQHVYAGDPTDDDDENCCRFDYSCNEKNGLPEICVSSRTQVKHKLNHAAGEAKRSRRADKELQFRMDVASGRR